MLLLHISPATIEEDIDEQVILYSNDVERPVSKLRIIGTVGAAIRLFPQQALALGPVYRSDLSRSTFPSILLVPTDGVPLGRIRLMASHPSIRPQIEPADGGAYRLAVTLDDTVPLGPLNEHVVVESEHPLAPVIKVPVLALVDGDFDSGRRRIDFGFIKEGRPASVTFRMANRGTKDVAIVRHEAMLSVPAQVEVTREDKRFTIMLRIGAMPAFTRLEGTLELYTDNPAEAVVRLPVSGGVLSDTPFEQISADGGDSRFLALVDDVLARGDRVPADRFYSDVLGGVKDERAIKVLLRVLADGSLAARMRAIELLAEFKTPDVSEALRLAITDDDQAFVRRLALIAYAKSMGSDAVPSLLLALQDDDDWVREDAATLLGRTADARAIPALRAAIDDRSPETAAAVRDALATLQARVQQR